MMKFPSFSFWLLNCFYLLNCHFLPGKLRYQVDWGPLKIKINFTKLVTHHSAMPWYYYYFVRWKFMDILRRGFTWPHYHIMHENDIWHYLCQNLGLNHFSLVCTSCLLSLAGVPAASQLIQQVSAIPKIFIFLSNSYFQTYILDLV